MPRLNGTIEGEEFLKQQTNQGYLKKASKFLKNPVIVECLSKDPLLKYSLEHTQLAFDAYQYVFFDKNNSSKKFTQRKNMDNIHL